MSNHEKTARDVAWRIRVAHDPKAEKTILAALLAVQRETAQRCVEIARDGCLVPPDGGSPTEDEVAVCDRITRQIQEEFGL